MKTPIYTGILQSDLDCAGFDLVNFAGTEAANGLPVGGVAGQLLQKTSGTDFDTEWATVTTGGGAGLDENTVTAEDIGLVGDGVTDNTTALQDWFDSLTEQVNVTLLVPDGVYVFSGALQDTSRQNAQIILPLSLGAGSAENPWTLTIKGYHTLSPTPGPGSPGLMPLCAGPVFKSTLATGGGTQPSFIGGMGPVGITDQNGLHVRFENMIFATVSNPLISCLNLGYQSWVEIAGTVIIIAGIRFDEAGVTEPTTTTSYGLILPAVNIGVLETLESVHIVGFYTALKAAELTLVEALGAYFCHFTVEFPFAYHPTLIHRLLDFHCKYGLNVTSTCAFSIQQMDIERGTVGAWNERAGDVSDAGNNATADITWWAVQGFIGVVNTFTVTGGTGIKRRQIGSDTHAGPVYIGTDARLTAISGGVIIEARNTGTGVWVEAGRWTNP